MGDVAAAGLLEDTLRDLQDKLQTETKKWFGPIKDIATWILFSLAGISWTWSAMQMVFRNADLQEFLVDLLRMVMFVGFFLALILNADIWSDALIKGFLWAGQKLVPAQDMANIGADSILTRGVSLGNEIISADTGFVLKILYALAAIFVIVIYAIIAGMVLLTFAEMYIVTAAGVILLGFAGGVGWTDEYAKRYLTYCISVGAKLYVMLLVVGLGEVFVSNWVAAQDVSQVAQLLSIVAILILMQMLVMMIPGIVQGIINGTSIGGGPSITAAGAMMGGAAAGAAVASKVLGAGKAAGAGMAAVNEAAKLASGTLGPAGSMMRPPGSFVGEVAANLGKAALETAGRNMIGNPLSSSFAGGMAQTLHAKGLDLAQNMGTAAPKAATAATETSFSKEAQMMASSTATPQPGADGEALGGTAAGSSMVGNPAGSYFAADLGSQQLEAAGPDMGPSPDLAEAGDYADLMHSPPQGSNTKT